MTIAVKFFGEASTRKRRGAFENLCALLMELPPAHFVLLSWMNAEIELQCERATPSLVPPLQRTIRLDIERLHPFVHRRVNRISAQQERALIDLKRETIAVIDAFCRFTVRRSWRQAARAELRCSAARVLDGLEEGGRFAPELQPASCAVLTERAWHRFIGKLKTLAKKRRSPQSGLLAEILLVRDDLRRTRQTPAQVDQQMLTEFRFAYPLVQHFDALIEQAAVAAAAEEFPRLASQPTAAITAMRAKVDVVVPADAFPPSLNPDHERRRGRTAMRSGRPRR